MAKVAEEMCTFQGRQAFKRPAVLGLLSAFCPISPAVEKRIQGYFAAATHLSLQPMLVLSSPEPELLAEIQGNWRLRETIAAKLSPQHLVIKADRGEKLMQKLERRHYLVNHPLVETAQAQSSELSPAMAEYLLLAVSSYQKLDSRVSASMHIPNALVDWLQAHVQNPAAIEAQANQLAATVQREVPESKPIQADTLQDTASIRRELEFALARGTSLSIDYYSPYARETTTRRIQVHEIYEANTFTYFEAYCELVGEVRTFRLDQVLRIQEDAEKWNVSSSA